MAATHARLLFGEDHSPGADLAWLWIHEQRWPDWDLVQLAARPPGMGLTVPHDRATSYADPTAPTRTSFEEAGFHAHVRLAADADPRIVLADTPAELVVVGSSGHRFGPDRLGSTAEWLLRHASAPLVTARTGRRVRRVLVCADGSPPSVHATEALARLPWSGDVEVTVLIVDDGRTDVDAARTAAHVALDGHIGPTHDLFRSGEPTRAVFASIDAVDAELVVLGTRGNGGIERLLLGSTAAAVVRHAPTVALTAR